MARSKSESASSDNSREREDLYIRAVREHAKSFLRLPGITSVGVGYRIQGGERTKELCIQYTVEEKKIEKDVNRSQLLPKSIQFVVDAKTKQTVEIPVDVLQRSYQTSHRIVGQVEPESVRDIRRERRNPIQPGISISNRDGTAGTLGAIVFDRDSGEPYVLSNWHVLQTRFGQIGDPIAQPGPYDDSKVEPNLMGRVVRSFLGLAGDCAIASIENRRFVKEILDIDGAVPTHTAKAQLNDRVVKSGRTTGTTYGIVRRVGVITSVDYEKPTGTQQIGGFEIGPDPDNPPDRGEISDSGDSGSLWLIADQPDVVVGLHFAGETDPNPAEEHAMACNIHSVLEQLNVQFADPLGGPESVPDARTVRSLMGVIADLNMRLAALEAKKCSCGGHGGGPEAVSAGTASPEALRLSLPVHGNWCGPGHGGGGPPIDGIDHACMIHDQCYGQRGNFDCSCDAELIRNLDQALQNPQLGFRAKITGNVIRTWFARVQPCRNRQ